jgi:PAS domain S-box-containing protein
MSDRPQDPKQTPADAAALRRLAEEQAGATDVAFPVGQTPESTRQMFHELRVHQIELEMQNEELRRAQVELEAARARYFDLYDLAPVGYCTLSEKGLILEVNLTAATLLGVSRRELVRQPLTRFILQEDQDIFYLHRRQLFETGSPQTCELRLRRTGGELCWARLDATAAQEADGAITCRVVLSDITDRKQAEAERERLRAGLAQADRLASVGTLAAGVAHEINNPLTYVLYNIESAVEDLPRLAERSRRCQDALARHLGHDAAPQAPGGSDDPGAPAAMEDVISRLREAAGGAQRIKRIVRGLGTFSRVDQEVAAPVALQSVIEQVLSIAANQIRYRARVVEDFSPVPAVLASDAKLAQVFLNLLINAAHAIDEGHMERNEIRVRTWAEGEAVFAEVSDTGKGIPPEHRGRVFDPFFTTKEIGVGSGLGLSITRNIVTGLGGEISFTSEVGQGTRFLVRLPRLPRDWQPAETAPPAEATVHAAPRGRILVVDDEPAIRTIITRMLEPDHEVLTAASGEEAQALLEQDRRFDLIFCDLMMPRISGMELHAWLAERDADLARQVVFITGGAFTPGASSYLAGVGNLRIEKPFDIIAFGKLTDELVLAARAKRGASSTRPG